MGEVGQVTVKCNILISSLYNQVFKLTFFSPRIIKMSLLSRAEPCIFNALQPKANVHRKSNQTLAMLLTKAKLLTAPVCAVCARAQQCRTQFNSGAWSHEALEESPSASPHIITNAFCRATPPSCFLRSLAPNKLDSSTWTQQVNTEGGRNIFNIQINICIYFFLRRSG